MNITDLHTPGKEVSTHSLFKGEIGSALALKLKSDAKFKEHITVTPAMLLCIEGKVLYEDDTHKKVVLQKGDYLAITPNVRHWLVAEVDSQLILLK